MDRAERTRVVARVCRGGALVATCLCVDRGRRTGGADEGSEHFHVLPRGILPLGPPRLDVYQRKLRFLCACSDGGASDATHATHGEGGDAQWYPRTRRNDNRP